MNFYYVDDSDDGPEAVGLARGRSRRSQPNKNIRLSALEKYKAARSGQVANKFEVIVFVNKPTV